MKGYDYLAPHSGPCSLCGDHDARHRLAEAIADRITSGEYLSGIAHDYGMELVAIKEFKACNNLKTPKEMGL